jgi:peptide/nickel transport system ATP-binding protein
MDGVEVHFTTDDGILPWSKASETVRAVDGVDLDIYENDVIAVVGESGCGKTTLGKAAIGLQNPTGGSIKYRGTDLEDIQENSGESDHTYEETRRALQIIHQDPSSSLNPNKTVKTTLELPLKRWYNDSRSTRRTKMLQMLEVVGLEPAEDYLRRFPHQLSGGEKQRVALVRALLLNPDLILADEAVSALDVSLRVEMMELLLELQETFNTSFLFISHNLSNARYLAGKAGGRIAVMYLGKIVEIGPAEEIIQNPQHPYTKVLKWSTPNMQANQEIEDPPVRKTDIPDPVNPPSGCSFHTRCLDAREVCRKETPELDGGTGNSEVNRSACFRSYDESHPYWDSEPIVDD